MGLTAIRCGGCWCGLFGLWHILLFVTEIVAMNGCSTTTAHMQRLFEVLQGVYIHTGPLRWIMTKSLQRQLVAFSSQGAIVVAWPCSSSHLSPMGKRSLLDHWQYSLSPTREGRPYWMAVISRKLGRQHSPQYPARGKVPISEPSHWQPAAPMGVGSKTAAPWAGLSVNARPELGLYVVSWATASNPT